jgi:hypothetical protein
MIERLRTSLAALASLPPRDMAGPDAEPLRRDAADAVRLALDCMQGDLTPRQRDVLRALSDRLEDDALSTAPLAAAPLADAVRSALEVARGHA